MDLKQKEKLVTNLITTKMFEFLLSGLDFKQALKECTAWFVKTYHGENRELVYNTFLTDYEISKTFVVYISGLPGFMDFIKSPNNIELIKSLSVKQTQTKKEEKMPEQINLKENTIFQNLCVKGVRAFIKKMDFNASIDKTVQGIAKSKPEFSHTTKEDVIFAIALKSFETIQDLSKNPLKNILLLVKLLSPDQLSELKSSL